MKVSSKPILSPGRTEKFPPPLMMRFLRSNVGSKSRGRSRSSPMFVRKNNSVIETQEPSSPKVTCIGQVRVRRSSKHFSGSNSGRSRTLPVICPFWLPKNWFRNPRKPRLRSFRSVWRKRVSFFRFGYCKKVDVRDDSSKVESNWRIHYKDSETEENDDEDEEGHGEFVPDVFISSAPPKNAFLLTRCRSAPYRSSSLAGRFLGSPQGNSETEEDGSEAKERCDFEVGERELEGPKSLLSEPNSRNLVAESRTDQESVDILAIRKHFENFINGRNSEADYTRRNAALPSILTRCKSEPAKTGERLINPENHQFLEPNKVEFSKKLVCIT